MPRRSRIVLPHVPMHVIQRGNNRSVCFVADEDYLFYLEHLEKIANKVGVVVHAYVLMTNHVHLLVTPESREGISSLMKRLGQRYVQYFNRMYKRSGTLWEWRFRSALVSEDAYFLGCQRYIELNPVRASMVDHPAEYRWSSYASNGQGQASSLIKAHALYMNLGRTDLERQAVYRELFRYQLDPGLVDEIRKATNGGVVLGSHRFADEVAILLGVRTKLGVSGRPMNKTKED